MSHILPCQALFGMSRGAQIQQAIEEDTGHACPCKQNRGCPLVPSGELEPLPDAGHSVTQWLPAPGAVPEAHCDRGVA